MVYSVYRRAAITRNQHVHRHCKTVTRDPKKSLQKPKKFKIKTSQKSNVRFLIGGLTSHCDLYPEGVSLTVQASGYIFRYLVP